MVLARGGRDVFLAVIAVEHGADVGNRFRREVDAVGPHIGDQAGRFAVDLDALVKPLRQSHGYGRGETELAACLLLHGRGGERRRRIATGRLCLDRHNRKYRVLEIAGERFRFGTRSDVEALDLLAVGTNQARFEDLVAWRRQLGNDRPIFLGDEFLDFEFAVAHKAQCDGLHAAGGASPGQLAPEHRRKGKTDKVIQRTAGEVGVHQGAVDLAWMFHRLAHRLLGDGVEHHALDFLVFERLDFFEHLEHVPGDRFTFAIRVGGEDELVGTLQGAGDIIHPLLRLWIDLPKHAEIVVRIDRAVFWGEVPNVAKRGQDLIAGAEVLIDRLRLGRQLDYDNIHGNPVSYPPVLLRFKAESALLPARNMGKVPLTVK